MKQQGSGAFTPLIELLQDELHAIGINTPNNEQITDSKAFAQWFLSTIQLLEQHVANSDAHMPMSRGEVELWCRCALTASNLAEAFTLIEKFAAMLYPRAGKLTVSRTATSLRVSLDTLRSERTMASSLVDIAGLFSFKQLFHWLSDGQANCLRVGIGEIPRSDLLAFLLLFNVPVLAEGEKMFLEYDLSVDEVPVVATIGDFDNFFVDFPCNLFEQKQQQLEQQVSALITAAVNQALPIPSQVDIAATLQIPLSTFRRKLSTRNQSFRSIREHCLQLNAEQLLQRESLNIIDVAERLGFKDGDTFRNAFKRWTGVSPQQWRLNQQQ